MCHPRTPALFGVAIALLCLAVAAAEVGCQQSKGAKTAESTGLTIAQELCAWQAEALDAEAVSVACGIVDTMGPALRALLASKATAARAGVLRPPVPSFGPGRSHPIDAEVYCAPAPDLDASTSPDASARDAGHDAGRGARP